MTKSLSVVFGFLTAALITIGCAQTDAGITTKVKSKFAADDTVKAYQIDVTTQEGVVTLAGEVENRMAKERAVALARETEGVKNVVDNLQVGRGMAEAPSDRGAEPTTGREIAGAMSDASITTAIKSKMLADTTVGGLSIDVDTDNGMVTLTGNVKNAKEKAEAVRIARETEGVKDVKDNLTIQK